MYSDELKCKNCGATGRYGLTMSDYEPLASWHTLRSMGWAYDTELYAIFDCSSCGHEQREVLEIRLKQKQGE